MLGARDGATEVTLSQNDEDELEYLSSATLTKRKDFIDREAEARSAPNRVLYYRRNADNDRLIQVCTDKLRSKPGNVRALLIRAASYVKTGELDLSVEDYSAVIALEADHVEATFHRGTVYEKLNKLDEAIADFTKVLSLEPDHVKASYARGTCRNLKGDFAPAIEDYAKALEKDRSAAKVRRKSHLQSLDGGSRPGTPSSVYSPDTGLIPASFTAPTASYQPYVNGAHFGSRPGTPAESSSTRQTEMFEDSGYDGAQSGPIFPESHQPWLHPASSASQNSEQKPDATHPTSGGSLQTMVLSQLSNPKSHPINVTTEDMEHSLTSFELAQAPLEQPWEQPSASMQNAPPGQKQKQSVSTASRGHNRASSFSCATVAALQPSRNKGHRRSNSGEAQPAVSHFVLPGKRPQGRALVQEPPLSTRSSYRLDSWENVPQLSALSIGMSRADSLQQGDSLATPMEPLSPSRQGSRTSNNRALTSAGQRARLAEEYHAQGYAFRKQGNFAAAIEQYSQAVALEPHHFKALFNRGFSWDKVGNYDQAIEDYTQALQVEPSNSYAYYNRGITRDRNGDYQGAVADFSQAISLDPSNADFFHNRGFSLRKQGRFEEALSDYSAAIELNPQHCRAFYNRAFSNDRLRRYDAAVADYTRALEMQPGNATAFHNRASLFERLGRLSEALKDFEQALAIEPKNALSHNARGLLLEKMGRPDAALADFEVAVQVDGGANVDFLRNRGLCCRALKDYSKAVQDFDRVLQQTSTDLAALSNRGYAHRKLGNFAAAAEDYSAALRLSPGTVRLYNNRGYCLAKLGKYKSAILDYQCVIELDPANAHAYHNRGISFDKLGEFKKAVADFTTVLKLDPSNVNAYFNRGSAYDSLGHYDWAVADYTKALDLDNTSPGPVSSTGTSFSQQGRLQSVPPSPSRPRMQLL